MTLLDKASITEKQQALAASEAKETLVPAWKQEQLFALLQALRPRQWTKNLALFVGIVFAQRLFTLPSLARACVAFIVFCLASSCIYLFNDLLDLENDRQHPAKRLRPLASGRLPVSRAVAAIVVLDRKSTRLNSS